ncbi:hypothetical protein HK097_008157 [Rhizophlyctis rosea]|uniref:Uncharacterized protein n=1 Tax=Rhizophlyctis rosea TaxID=64517 RepID=A0AAD5SDU7_9FUNG|nr:hypothetical protein HK097_008157 [Rhizophlyctis rosea]
MDPIQTSYVRPSPTSDRPTSPLPPKSPSKPTAPSSFRRLFPRASVILSPKDVAALRDQSENGSEGSYSSQTANSHSHSPTTPPSGTQHNSRSSTPTSSESGQARLAKLAGWQLADLAIQVVREVDARGGEKAGVGRALRHGCARALVVARERELERIASGGAGGLFSSAERDSGSKDVNAEDGHESDIEVDAENVETHHTSHHTSDSAPESAASSSAGPQTPSLPSPHESLPLIAAAKMKSMPLMTLNQLASDVEREAERRYPDLGIVQSKKARGSNGDGEELLTGDGPAATRQDSMKSHGSKDGEGGERKEKHGKPTWRDSRFWFSGGGKEDHHGHRDEKHKGHKEHHPKPKGRHGSPLGPPYTRTSYHPNGRPRPRSMSAPHLPGLEPEGKGKRRDGPHVHRGDAALPTPPRSPTPIYEDEVSETTPTDGNSNPYITQMAHNLATNWRQTLESSIEIDSQSNNTEEPNAQTKEMINQLDDGQFWSLYADCVDEVARRKGLMAVDERGEEIEDGLGGRSGNGEVSGSAGDHPEPNSVFAKLSYGELVGLHAIVEAEAARRREKDKPKRGGGAVMWDKEESENENNDEVSGRKGKKRINGWSIASKQTIDLVSGDNGAAGVGDGADVLRNGIPSPPPRTVVPPTTPNGLLLPPPASSSASSASTLSFRNLKPKGLKSDKTASTVAIWSSEVVKEDAEVEKILERFGTLERVRRGSRKSGGSGSAGGDGADNRTSDDTHKLTSNNRASDAPTVEDTAGDSSIVRGPQYQHAHLHLHDEFDTDANIFTPSPQSPQAGLSPLRMADTLASDLSPLRMADSPGEGLSPLRMADSPNTVEVSLLQKVDDDEDKELDLGTSHGGSLALNPVPPPRVSSRKEKGRPSPSPPLPNLDHPDLRTPATGPVCPPTHIHPHRNRVRTALHSLSNTQLSLAARQVADEVRRRQRFEWGDGIEVAGRGGSVGSVKGEMDLERLPMHRLELLARDIAEEAIRRGMAK